MAAGTAAAAGIGLRRFRGSDGSRFDSDAYRLLAREPVGAGMKRVLAAQVDDAIAQLRGEAGTEPAEAIHEARKDVKKIRSALRLVRHEIGEDVWRRENDHYREVARKLSGFRDAEILVEALDGLAERFGPIARRAVSTRSGSSSSRRTGRPTTTARSSGRWPKRPPAWRPGAAGSTRCRSTATGGS